MQIRCVYCGGSHRLHEPPLCANCGEAHSYKSCPGFSHPRATARTINAPSHGSSAVEQGRSISQATAQTKNNVNISTNTQPAPRGVLKASTAGHSVASSSRSSTKKRTSTVKPQNQTVTFNSNVGVDSITALSLIQTVFGQLNKVVEKSFSL